MKRTLSSIACDTCADSRFLVRRLGTLLSVLSGLNSVPIENSLAYLRLFSHRHSLVPDWVWAIETGRQLSIYLWRRSGRRGRAWRASRRCPHLRWRSSTRWAEDGGACCWGSCKIASDPMSQQSLISFVVLAIAIARSRLSSVLFPHLCIHLSIIATIEVGVVHNVVRPASPLCT